ncbi:MAG: M20 family metallopeptidase [Chloroflexi bacterium]|nr:M20 family metallopeptidase [Chloroflexota bacterium]
MINNNLQQEIITAVDSAREKILDVSHQIHEHPELGDQEVFASDLLTRVLESFQFKVERGYTGLPTAFCARKGNGGGPRVAFLCEYDALPEIGHGCGHNVIGSASLAAGIGLGAVVDRLGGELWVIGTPAEETNGAKVWMVEKGAFRQVDAALMIHPHDGNYVRTESLAMDAIQVTYFGKPSHAAATPWEGKNALDGLILLFNGINALRQQVQPDARIHGIVTYGGAAPNIIPEKAQGRFYVRAKTRKYLNQLVEKFKACAQGAALASGTRVEFENYEFSFDDMLNNMALAERVQSYAEALGAKPFHSAPDSFGSVDMGNVSHGVPAVHVLIDIADGKILHSHTREFCTAAATPYADEALLRAGKALALAGCDLLSDEAFLQRVKQEFKENIA